MAFPHSHKTVIMLDRSPTFLQSSQQTVDFDVFAKNRGQGFIPVAPISKLLWTCSVEAAVEYSRLVYDIHPANRLIRFVTSDTEGHVLNSWKIQEQSVPHLMTILAQHGLPDGKFPASCSQIHGLTEAIRILCEPTDAQQQRQAALQEDDESVINRGRIICLTSLNGEHEIRRLEECVQDVIVEHNKLAESTDTLMPLAHVELDIVHTVPVGRESCITHRTHRELSSLASSVVHVTQSGHFLATKMVELATLHYDLASTIVTGIPMKEEQNAASSANYDVELLHSSKVHFETLPPAVITATVVGPSEPPVNESIRNRTVTLKWCTPKSNTAADLQQCSGTYRITPLDVNSRPSSCLTNFLLNGRAVMLEQPRKVGTRLVSHMLASHGGELYIHVLATHRVILEDPPSISEGCGGRVTDYRINDFGEFMKEARLAPVNDAISLEESPIERAKSKLERMTRHWPLVIGDTIIFNMQSHMERLPALVVKETMTDDELLECKKVVFHLVGIESRNEPLPAPPSGTRGKGPKRDEQYRQMWNELEKLVRAHTRNSSNHELLLECVQECRKPSPEDTKTGASPKKAGGTGESAQSSKVKDEKPDPSALEASLREYDRYQTLTEREKLELNKAEDRRAPESPPVPKKPRITWDLSKNSGPQSLMSIWTSKVNALHSARRQEFAGREDSQGPLAKLYINLDEKPKGGDAESTGNSHGKSSRDLNKK